MPKLTTRKTDRTKSKEYCNKCMYVGDSLYNLKRHERCHTPKHLFRCLDCDYITNRSENLTRHMKVHNVDEPKKYKCSSCEYETNDTGNFRRHLYTHSTEKPYSCDVCDYTTGHQPLLKMHMNKHAGIKPYICDICDAAFSYPGNCQRHRLTHTALNNGPHKCPRCNYRAFQKVSLQAHIKCYKGSVITCKGCDFRSCTNALMNKHSRECPDNCDNKQELPMPPLVAPHIADHTYSSVQHSSDDIPNNSKPMVYDSNNNNNDDAAIDGNEIEIQEK
ncbi:unnamed protein product [Owenia fusiformis]|uniref:Uncharacterized protein n=1 Tax=Owenia fusiformis TaxID=6347 RepID=A0A8J1TRL6_OWEFU|nr:unnamed protein product [Owenia fusiformis]